MVKVRALQKCFVDNCMRQIGDVFDHNGKISKGVMIAVEDERPVDKPVQSKAAKEAAAKADALSATAGAEAAKRAAADAEAADKVDTKKKK